MLYSFIHSLKIWVQVFCCLFNFFVSYIFFVCFMYIYGFIYIYTHTYIYIQSNTELLHPPFPHTVLPNSVNGTTIHVVAQVRNLEVSLDFFFSSHHFPHQMHESPVILLPDKMLRHHDSLHPDYHCLFLALMQQLSQCHVYFPIILQ